jgi:hypothetical protein
MFDIINTALLWGSPRRSYGYQEKATWIPVRGIIVLRSSFCPHVAHTTFHAVDGVGPSHIQPWSGWRCQGLSGASVPAAVEGMHQLMHHWVAAHSSSFAQSNRQKSLVNRYWHFRQTCSLWLLLPWWWRQQFLLKHLLVLIFRHHLLCKLILILFSFCFMTLN